MVEEEEGEGGVVAVVAVVQLPAAAPCPGATTARGPPCLWGSSRNQTLMSYSSLCPLGGLALHSLSSPSQMMINLTMSDKETNQEQSSSCRRRRHTSDEMKRISRREIKR